MKTTFLLLATIILFGPFTCPGQKYNPQIAADDFKSHLGYLASDELKGRLPGSEGDVQAADYIRSKFKAAGLTLLGDKGFQYFEVTMGISIGPKNSFSLSDSIYAINKDYTPLSFSGSGTVHAEVVFAGYGFSIKTDSLSWDDYADIDAKGKWVMLLRADPDLDNTASPFAQFSTDRYKVMNALDHGAAGVILVNTNDFDSSDALDIIKPQRGTSSTRIPVVQVKRQIAETLISPSGYTLIDLETSFKSKRAPVSFNVKSTVDCSVDLLPVKAKTMNIVGMMKGKTEELIIIGAHYDHLGMGGESSRSPGIVDVHNGADDNASGVGMIIELAQRFSKEKPERGIVFIAFGAEELGLLGSKYFVENPLVDLKNVKAMFNYDMVGRLNEDKSIIISGTGTALQTDSLLRIGMDSTAFSIAKSPGGTGPSDHSSFYSAGIPVLFFSTGVHDQYHTPDDDIALINFDGMVALGNASFQLLNLYTDKDQPLTYKESQDPQREGMRRRMKVTLGIVPDFAENIQGLGVAGVRSGGPAYLGGILKGDIITGIEGKEVTNIYDYMNRMGSYSVGQRITVEVLRGDKKLLLLIQL